MISDNKDKLISELTVRLKNSETDAVIGTGIIYYEKKLKDKIYIITASHCLFNDGDHFEQKFETIKIELYNKQEDRYDSITIDNIEDELLIKDKDNDLAVILVEKDIVQKITGKIPSVEVSIERQNHSNFVVKGFPRATQGKELDAIFPIWKQKMTEVNKFQLELTESYSDHNARGFSGSGVFLIANGSIYLYGIFTRFRSEDRGKVIYCQFISLINQLLSNRYLPEITISYIGNNGLSVNFFKNHIKKSVKNLGPRFSEELNFKLPIAKLFNDLSFNNNFKSRFFKVLDKWLLERIYDEFKSESDLKKIDDEFFKLKEKVKKWGENTPISIEKPINIEWVVKDIEVLNSKIDEKERTLRDLQYEEEKRIREKNKGKEKEHYGYNARPYEKELNRLRKISSANNELLINLDEEVNIYLSNNPILIIDGEAGSGKSHLLGDIANERLKNNIPTVLLLGQHFTISRSLENNIIHLLDINCSFEELLNDLNDIGKQIGSRVLLLIDAINEGAGGRLWRDQIQGLITQVSNKKYIGIAITIRTTYLKSIISNDLKQKKSIVFKTHLGFKGNEYAALKMFCDFHKLKQPSFPILSPEFTNPLFLKIICEGVKNSEAKEFPQGFHGVKKVFDLFIKAIDKKLEEKRDEYINRNLVIKVIHELAFKIFESEYKRLLLDDAFLIMNEKFPKFNHLLNDLIEEGVFIKNLFNDYSKKEDFEVIYFAYERFGDFYIATELLKGLDKKEDLILSFKQGAELGKLLEDEYYMHDGILESMSTLLPEMYDLEIFDVYSWVYKEIDKFKKNNSRELISNRDFHHYSHLSSWISKFFLNSLNWRTIESINDEKITKWLQNGNHRINDDEWFLKLIELTAIKNHPMNSDRLFRILSRYSMAERDSFWQIHLRYYNGYDDNDNGFPIRRLIDWAWSDGITSLIDDETARLCGQTLAWVLTSTNKILRDQITKALVNLLEEHPNALISILKTFENIDDLYITERLYAVSYGCVLRASNNNSIIEISQYVFDTIFKLGNPPNHILLRDYARNTVEYAMYKALDINCDPKLIRPPYKSKIPKLPSIEDISKYNVDYKSSSFDKEYGHTYNGIYYNVIEWDFGRKTIDPELHNFYPINFNDKKKYKSFYNTLNKDERNILKGLKKHYRLKEQLNKNKGYSVQAIGEEESYNRFLKTLNQFETKVLEIANDTFKEKDIDFVKDITIPYLKTKAKIKSNSYWTQLDSRPFKRWIVKRVFELGYDMKLHGRFDKDFSRFSGRYSDDNKIGTKYQWIAFHDILAVIADNYKIESRSNNGKEYNFYKGTWQLYARDIDPISTTKTKGEYDEKDEFEDIIEESSWWSKLEYNYWDKSNSEWSESLNDLPNTKEVIIKVDDNGDEWFFLEYYPSWEEPKIFGEEKYHSKRKNLHYLIQGYLVRNEDKETLINYLKDKNFFGRWMPENGDRYSKLFNREKFWSPAYLDIDDEPLWSEICDNETHIYQEQKIMVATTNAKGSISDDKSGANFNYNIPCKMLFEGLELEYSNIDGDFVNKSGVKIVTNINPKGTLIRKKELIEYLDKKKLSIVWTILGEKIAESEDRFYHFGVPCGAFYLDNGSLKGELKMYSRD